MSILARWCRWRPRVPALVLAATAAFGALLVTWSVMAPLLEAPDEPDHLALVLELADGRPYPEFDGLQSPWSVYRLCTTFASSVRACPRPDETVTATGTRRHPLALAPDRRTRPAWDDDGGDEPVGALNQMPQHPPLYYQLMAKVVQVARLVNGGPMSLDRELALLRLANVALLVPLPLLTWWGARRFGLDQLTATGAAVALLGLPMLTHIGSTLNNDNLLVLCGSAAIALLAGVVRGDRSLATALAVGAAIGVGLLTKGFAIVFVPLTAVAYAIGARNGVEGRWSDRLRGLARPLGAAALVVVAVAGWWYVGLRVRTGSFTPTVEDDVLTTALRPPDFRADPFRFAADFGAAVDQRFWGAFGWYSVRLSGPFAWFLTALVLAAVASALAGGRTPGAEGRPPGRLATAWLLGPVGALGVLVVARSWDLYATTSKLVFAQGRYLFAGVTGLAVVVAIGVRRAAGRWTPTVLAVAAVALQAHALRRALVAYWGSPGVGPIGQVRALVAYGGWPGELVVALGALAAVAMAGFAGATLCSARAALVGDASGSAALGAHGSTVRSGRP